MLHRFHHFPAAFATLALVAVTLPFAAPGMVQAASVQGIRFAIPTSSTQSTCTTKTGLFQGHHQDGSIDPTSVVPAVVTTCFAPMSAATSSSTNHNPLSARRDRFHQFQPVHLRVPNLLTPQDQYDRSYQLNCGGGVVAYANGHEPASANGYLHWEYINPNDGQTVDYIFEGLGGGPVAGEWSASVRPTASNIAIFDVRLYQADSQSGYSLDYGHC